MKHFYLLSFVLLTFLAAQAANPIHIVYDNDVHCALDGYVAIAGVRDSLAQTDALNTALVSSGDYLQGSSMGSISKGQYSVDMLNAVHYDALTLGNHELDYKMPHLKELVANMATRPVCCNLYDLTSEQPNLVFAPYVLKTFSDNRKVAFIGALTPYTMIDERYAFYDDLGQQIYTLCPDSFCAVVQHVVDEAREAGATHVVVLSHVGEIPFAQYPTASQDMIAATTGIDVVLDAHSHSVRESVRLLNKDGESVLLSQTGTQVKNIGVLTIDTDRDTLFTQLLPVASCPRSAKVQHVLDSLNLLADTVLSEKIGTTAFALTIEDPNTGLRAVRNTETNLGDLVTDAFRSIVPGAQISLQNGGGIRKTIQTGTITKRNVIDVLSFCNMEGSYIATGQMLLDFLEESYQSLPAEGTFVHVSGLKLQIDTTQHPVISYNPADSVVTITGTRRVFDVQVLQTDSTWLPLDPDEEYSLVATDYLVFQQSLYSLLKCQVLATNLMEDNAALGQYISKDLEGVIPDRYQNPYGEGRIVFAARPTDLQTTRTMQQNGTKILRNGTIYILRDGCVYNLLGQQL